MKARDVLISYSRDRKLLDEIFQTSLVRFHEICLGYDDSIAYRGFLSAILPCQLVLREYDHADIFSDLTSGGTQFRSELEGGLYILEKKGYEFHYFYFLHRSYRLIINVFDKVSGKTINFRDRSDYKEYEILKLFIESCVK